LTSAVLGPTALVKQDARWQLSPDLAVASDLDQFYAAIEHVRLAAPGSPEEASWLASALDLYAGPYLDGVPAAWVERRRAEIESLHQELQSRQAERHLAAGENRAAVRLAQGLLRAQPLSDDACRLLLRALIAAGQRVNAWQVYSRFAKRAEEQLGVPKRPLRAFLAET
jgi:two-component system, LytTR family, response regulator